MLHPVVKPLCISAEHCTISNNVVPFVSALPPTSHPKTAYDPGHTSASRRIRTAKALPTRNQRRTADCRRRADGSSQSSGVPPKRAIRIWRYRSPPSIRNSVSTVEPRPRRAQLRAVQVASRRTAKECFTCLRCCHATRPTGTQGLWMGRRSLPRRRAGRALSPSKQGGCRGA